MAASTLQAMLIRLGFDLTGLAAGGSAAKAQLASIQAAAVQAQAVVNAGNAGQFGRAAQLSQAANAWKQVTAAAVSGAPQIVAAQAKIEAAMNRLNVSMGGLKLIAGTIALFSFVSFTHGAVEAAASFQTQMTLLQTQARASATEVNNMTDAILRMAVSVQTGPEALAKGLYHIESVGIRGAKALDILTIAAEGARVGNADLESVTNAMVAAVTSGISGVENMTTAMGTLNGIVGSGNMRMQDLADSLRSGVLATATAFGVSLQQIGAALATMTDQGIPATEAATRLRITIALLGAPTKVAAEQLSRIGLTSTALAYDMRGKGGLIGAVEDLSAHLKQSGLDAVQQSAILKAAFGGSRSSSGLLTLINTTELANLKLQVIGETARNFAETFRVQSETAAAKFAALGAAIEVLSVHFGNALLPFVTAAASAMSFLAQQTALMVPILVLITAVVVRLAFVALARLIASLGLNIAYMTLGKIATILLTQGLTGLAASGVVASVSLRGLAAATLTAIGPLNLLLIALAAVSVAYINVKADADKAAAAFNQRIKDVAAKSSLDELQAERARLVQALEDSKKHDRSMQGVSGALIGISATSAIQQSIIDVDQAIASLKTKVTSGLVTTSGIVIDETMSLIDQLGTSMAGVMDAAGGLSADLMSKYAKELLDNQNLATDAYKALVDAEETALKPSAEIAQLQGYLASKALADGLRSGIASVRAAALAAQGAAKERLFQLGINAESPEFNLQISALRAANAKAAASAATLTGAVRAMNAAIRDTGASASDAAKKLLEKFGSSIDSVKAMMTESGADLAQAIADGIASNQQAPVNALKKLHTALQSQQSVHAQIAFLLAALAGQDIARGLKSSDPAAVAQANATVKIYTDQLDRLTNGAYSAGMNAANNFIAGWALPLARGHANAQAIASLQKKLSNNWGTGGLTPAEIAAGQKAYNDLIKDLNKVGVAAGNTASALQTSANTMTSAWATIKADAMKYFDAVHKANLQAIEDRRKALQAPIDAAQARLNAVQGVEQLQSLRRAVQEATNPQDQLRALQALHNFMAQQQIDAAQKSADAQIAAAKDAEDKRYATEIAAFNKSLNSLITYLDKHPKLWKSAQQKVISLLHSYGISYQSSGELLGNSFAKGFVKALQNLEKGMAGALKIKVSWATLVVGGKGFAEGAWKLAQDQIAKVHAGEMIVPASAAGPLRDWLSHAGGGAGSGTFGSLAASAALASKSSGPQGGGTLILKIGDEKIVEIVDRRLVIAKGVRGEASDMVYNGSAR